MNSEPYHNEPGFEKETLEQDVDSEDDVGGTMFAGAPGVSPHMLPAGAQSPVGQQTAAAAAAAAAGAGAGGAGGGALSPLSPSVAATGPSAPSAQTAALAAAAAAAAPSVSSSTTAPNSAAKKRRRDPEDVRAEAAAYGDKVTHESLRVAVCDVVESVLAGKTEYFCPEIKREFLMRYETYVEIAEKNLDKDGAAFVKTPFEYPTNLAEGRFDYKTVLERLKRVRAQLDEETESWKQKGAELTRRKSYIASTLRDEHARLLQDGMHGCSGGPVDPDNVFVWNLSIMQPAGLFEEGMFDVEIVFPESKDEYPRVRFKTNIFHPNISPSGYACFNIPPAKQECIDYIFSSIRKLLTSEPNPSTATWVCLFPCPVRPTTTAAHAHTHSLSYPTTSTPQVNIEAAELCFATEPEKQKQWRRKVMHPLLTHTFTLFPSIRFLPHRQSSLQGRAWRTHSFKQRPQRDQAPPPLPHHTHTLLSL